MSTLWPCDTFGSVLCLNDWLPKELHTGLFSSWQQHDGCEGNRQGTRPHGLVSGNPQRRNPRSPRHVQHKGCPLGETSHPCLFDPHPSPLAVRTHNPMHTSSPAPGRCHAYFLPRHAPTPRTKCTRNAPPTEQACTIREELGGGVVVTGLEEAQVLDADEMLRILQRGSANRATGASVDPPVAR